MAAIFVFAYACYNLDHANIVAAIEPWNKEVPHSDLPAHLIYAAAALLAGAGATFLTWAKAYRPFGDDKNQARTAGLSVHGPYRHLRNPEYVGYFLLLAGLSTFQSRLGAIVMLVGEMILLVRLILREETSLEQKYGEHFREYCRCVPQLVPSIRPRAPADNQLPEWKKALFDQAFQWGLVATLIAFACTLNDPVGYAFGLATLAVLVAQKVVQRSSARPVS
jgi:protein-S-isoprenylcysteine O-methyltransferase Ste14